MSNKKTNIGSIGIILILPVSFVLILVLTYIALYGTNFPIEIRLKSRTTVQYENLAKSWTDSLRALKDAISRTKSKSQEYSKKLAQLEKEIRGFNKQRQLLSTEVSKLKMQADSLKLQINTTRLARIQKLTKAMKAMQDQQLDSLVVQLDDQTLIELLQNARDKQVAMILGALEPKRAAKLTKKYLRTKK